MFGSALLLASVAVGAWAACQYEIKNLKIDTCDGKPVKEWSLKGLGAELTDKCNLRIKGCFKLNEKLSSITVKYKLIKNGVPVATGSEGVCEQKLFDTTFHCPMAKDTNICSNEKWEKEFPKGTLNMAVGKMKGEAEVITDLGVKCYKVSADVKRK